MTSGTRLMLSAVLLAVRPPGAAERRLPEGTYALTFCYPTCDDSASVVGTATLVYVEGDIRRLMTRGLADSLRGDVNFLLEGRKTRPNACFQASAQRNVANQEYYVGIIRASLTVVKTLPHDSISIGLYASPDAFFDAVVSVDSSGVMAGVGHQSNWDGSRAPVTRVAGRRIGPPDPRACVPSNSVR
jgi:hypothetical protein